ncbi:cadherin-like beta sandwich domain-containing protein [Erysipelothrix inopinata]|uniref:receptor protein-tyrosine kinase n=1 Tax=Erysipelothrix inopinata TaxID=225084 RepID=A0A7G9RYF6_9FIRM|nr:cadherin-like beta sandwich domain-containing protein [Erysipelothrix inopinata]QNN60631.1 cadherin-like beta sandwich domain-containing protein [Erysipelothrix inopinata]
MSSYQIFANDTKTKVSSEQPEVHNFEYTGKPVTFNVEKDGLYLLESWGAQGGSLGDYRGGKGGFASGEIYLKKGEELTITVGGDGDYNGGRGYNGGGSSYNGSQRGGGATDFRVGGTSIYNRILVAGGGGAAGKTGHGGAGGGLEGLDASGNSGYGKGATQSSYGYFNGGFATGGGGTYDSNSYNAVAGGGGGGWYGGGGNRNERSNSYGYGGGGGSGYVLTGSRVENGITIAPSYRPGNYAPESKYEMNKAQLSHGNESFFGIDGVREIGHESHGHARITYYGKDNENSADIDGIRINGNIIQGFDPKQLEYTIKIPGEYSQEDEITVDRRHVDQVIVGTGKVNFEYHNLVQKINVFSADGKTSKVYTLNFEREPSNKLFNLKADNHTFKDNISFDPNVKKYFVDSFLDEEVSVSYMTFDKDAVGSVVREPLSDNKELITLSVQRDGIDPFEYEIEVTKHRSLDFEFQSKSQIFIAPYDGEYKLEAWGAQGGSLGTYNGGKGGYTSGHITLQKGEEITVTVGGFGDYNNGRGYNGGGSSYNGSQRGGGATDFRVGGTGIYNRILVAGGGGAAGQTGHGGAGGGTNGVDATGNSGYGKGATQNSYGYFNGSFGTGGGGTYDSNSYNSVAGGGGGGWFGGGGNRNERSNSYGYGGGGGSGYVLTGKRVENGITIPQSYRPGNYVPNSKYEMKKEYLANGNESFFGIDGTREIGHAEHGYARITYFGKNTENTADLDAIRINGKIIEGFDPNKYEYTIKIPGEHRQEDEITVDLRHSGQVVAGTGKVEFEYHNQVQKLTVFSADGKTNKVYTLNFEREPSNKLYDLKVTNHVYKDDEAFEFTKNEYTVESFKNEKVEVEYQTFDINAVVTTIYQKDDKDNDIIIVNVSNDGIEDNEYRIKVIKMRSIDFDFKSKSQVFIAPYDGEYQLEAWGAQGGSLGTYNGGKGGYTSGHITLQKGEEITVTVGGFGDYNNGRGYNGGGSSYNGSQRGGGATDFRIGGSSLYHRILVAGGGGAAGQTGHGGAGGGTNGVDASGNSGYGKGATQNSYGYFNGSFGTGGGGTYDSNSYNAVAGGGGGGWYGGGGNRNERSNSYGYGGGGGSGYVLTGKRVENGITIPQSYRPGNYAPDSKYEMTQAQLMQGNESFFGIDGIREIGHAEHGYARITYFGKNTENTADLDAIRINGKIIEGFDPNKYEYTIVIPGDYRQEDEITVDRRHSGQVIAGTGKVKNNYHNTSQTISVISADKKVKQDYKINFKREKSTQLYDLKVDEYTNAFSSIFDSNKYEYDMKSYVYGGLNIIATTYDEDAKVKVEGASNEELLPGDNTIRVTVSREGIEDSVYIIKAHRQRDMSFGYTRKMEQFTVPYTGMYRLETWGAQGGRVESVKGGKGAYAAGDIYLMKGEILNITVGGDGEVNSGYNGGGTSYNGSQRGGGATDIRVGGTSVYNRILVAAGGGAAGKSGAGADGGGTEGQNASGRNYGKGATQSSGGASSGAFGNGGSGTYDSNQYRATAGGGGGGWYGGGGNRNERSDYYGDGGGGGSSYAFTDKSYKPTNYAPSNKYQMTNTVLGAGSFSMPGPEGFTITGKEGDGAVRISILNLYSSDATLKSLELSSGTMDKPFSPNQHEYNVVMDTEQYELVIKGDVTEHNAELQWDKDKVLTIMPGTTVVELPVIAQDGTMGIYKLNIYREASKDTSLKNLSINEKSINNFDSKTMNYEIELDYKQDRNALIDGIKNKPGQVIEGLGNVEFENNKPVSIRITSETGNESDAYTITPRIEDTNLLKSLKLTDVNFEFEPETFDYDVDIPMGMVSINVDAVAYDHEATINVSGNGYLRPGKNKITVTVDEPHVGKQVYLINVNRSDSGEGSEDKIYEYVYKGKSETFVAPYTGNYQLEAWGAEGGNRGSQSGGKGGYANGLVHLKQGEELTINVGGFGNSISRGYNGGGASASNGVYGGGASDIRVAGETLYHRILVAGGGGSVGASNKQGGAGGGNYGQSRSENYGTGGQGGSQTAAGLFGEFGLGGRGVYANNGRGGAGGGGWYGGGGVNPDYSADDDRGGGGGSGYVLTETSHKPKGYTVDKKYYLSETELKSGLERIPGKDSGYTVGNSGNGYVRITALRKASEDNHLSKIEISSGKLTPEFDLKQTEYTVDLDADTTELNIKGVAMDPHATIVGNGKYDIPAGNQKFDLLVTAENGDVKTYTLKVNRPASKESMPENILINGLIPSLCSASDDYCKLSPKFDVNQDFGTQGVVYSMTVPSRIRSLEFSVIKSHAYQIVTGEGVIELQPGYDNHYYIDVMSEDGESFHAYSFEINRDMTGNADLESLTMLKPERDLEFNPDITEYYVSVPHEFEKVSDLDIHAETMDPNAVIDVKAETAELELGMNTLTYEVTAENGLVKNYTLNIYREESSNVFLKSLEILHKDEALPLSPNYQKVLNDYVVNVENEIDEVELVGVVDNDATSVEGLGVKKLEVGSNQFVINTQAQDGTKGSYRIQINRSKSKNAKIKSLSIGGKEMDPFDPDVLKQTFEVADDVINPDLKIELANELATYTTSGNTVRLRGGKNTINVRVTADHGNVNQYVFTVNKAISDNNELTSITSNLFEIEDFNPETLEYNITIPYTEERLNLITETKHPLTEVSKHQGIELLTGVNRVEILATAESGRIETYSVNITMKPNVDARLKSIMTKPEGTMEPEFNPDTYKYTLNVNNEIDMIEFVTEPMIQSTVMSGNGKHELKLGSNSIEIKTRAEDGTPATYTIEVVRDQSSNTDLKTLYVHEGALHREFKSDVIEYSLLVPQGTSKLTVEALPVNPKSKIQILDNVLNPGKNRVIVRVDSEGLSAHKDYALNVTVQEKASENIGLKSLKTSSGTFKPEFDSKQQFYRTTVENDVTKIDVSGEAITSQTEIKGLGSYPLQVGENLIKVRTRAKNNIIMDYQIVVTRKPSSDASLAGLYVNGLLDKGIQFDKNVSTYSGKTDRRALSVSASPYHPKATYEVLGNHDFVTGTKNVVIVRVTAEDRQTTKDYTITVDKVPSKNANLSHLSISGVRFEPTFVSNKTVYKASAPFELHSVNVSAKAEDDDAVVNYPKTVPLKVGDNFIDVEVVSEASTSKVYTVVVNREGSDNTNLKELSVDGNQFETFKNDQTSYELNLDYSHETIQFDGILEDKNATLTGIGTHELKVGRNQFNINVTAENGTVKTFTFIVNRAPINSAKLKNLKVDNYPFDEGFSSDVNEYFINVDNEVTTLQMEIEKIDPNATYKVTGNQNLEVGDNTITIEVTSNEKDLQETYTIHAYRQIYANNYLEYLAVNKNKLTPSFYKGTLVYNVDLTPEESTLKLDGEATLTSSKVEGLGNYDIPYGETHIKIPVTSKTGITRTYHVFVNRSRSHENYLQDLSVKLKGDVLQMKPAFDPKIQEYTLVNPVPIGTESVDIGVKSLATTISGSGQKKIKVGDNKLEVVVTSDSGRDRVYTINLTRPASDNNALTNIKPSNGALTPNFIYTEDTYQLNTESVTNTLSFDVSTEDRNARITGHERKLLPTGESVRVIKVTAENGDVKEYTINIGRAKTDETRLSNLSVKGYKLQEPFQEDVFTYHLKVPNSKTNLKSDEVIFDLVDKHATVEKTGVLELKTAQENIYEIRVRAVDGYTMQTYRIIVEREVGDNSKLKNIEFESGTLDKNFNPNVTDYTLELTDDNQTFDKSFIKKIAATDPNATIIYETEEPITLEANVLKPFVITVHSENGKSKTSYTFNVTYKRSKNNALSGIQIEGSIFKQPFDPNVTEYEVGLLEDTKSVVIRAFTQDPKAKILSTLGDKELLGDSTRVAIQVQSESGDIREYVLILKRNLSNTLDLKNIEVTDAQNAGVDPTYNNQLTQYRTSVAREVDRVGIIVTKGHPSQTINVYDKYNNPQDISKLSLKYGNNDFRIETVTPFGLTKDRMITIHRNGNDDTSLKSLEILNTRKPFEFEEGKYEYHVEIETDTQALDIKAVAQDPKAQVEIINNEHLSEGNNDVIVRVRAENGRTQDTILHVLKEPRHNSYLQGITVSENGKVISQGENFSPRFKRSLKDYSVEVGGNTDIVLVEGTPQVNTTLVQGVAGNATANKVENGVEVKLKSGNNPVTLLSTEPEEGNVSIYNVNIVRSMSSDATLAGLIPFSIQEEGLKDLQFEEGDFSQDRLYYTLNLDENAQGVEFKATPTSPNARVMIRGNEPLLNGKNHVTISVTSEDRTKTKTYFVEVNKKLSGENGLDSLKVMHDDITKSFDLETEEAFRYNVNSATDMVRIEAKAHDALAKIKGNGDYALDYGENKFMISVEAQNGDTKEYPLVIVREYDNRLQSIKLSHGTLDPVFKMDTLEYVVWVPQDVERVMVEGIALNRPIAQVSGGGWKSLEIGDNHIPLTVSSPDGSQSVYNVKVVRSASFNNYLEILEISEGLVSPTFVKDHHDYETFISDEHQSVTLTLKPEDPKATVKIISHDAEKDGDGNYIIKNLNRGTNKVEIRVEAENKETRDYTLKIVKQDASLFSNRLSSLTVTPSKTMSPTFKPNTNRYVVNVDMETTEVTIDAVKESSDATILSGVGTFEVKPGRNSFKIVVQSKDGVLRIYEVIINQALSGDASLQDLRFKEGSLSPLFMKTRKEYALYVPKGVEYLTPEIKASSKQTTWTVSGNGIDEPMKDDNNRVKIVTQSANGKNSETYIVNVYHSSQQSIYLESLTSNTGIFVEPFDKTNGGPYTLKLPADVKRVLLTAKPEDESAVKSIEGAGIIDLEGIQSKTVPIVVTGKNDATMTYVVKIQKDTSASAMLAHLMIHPGKLEPQFTPLRSAYTAAVPHEQERVEIAARAMDETALITGDGVHDLEIGLNEFDVVVTSRFGEIAVYDVDVTRDSVQSSKATSIRFKEAMIENPRFDKDIEAYTLSVPYEVTDLTVDEIILEDPINATYEIKGNKNLKVGTNTVQVVVHSKHDIPDTIYEFTVTRQIFSSNYLKDLITNQGHVSPSFDKYHNNYEIEVPYEVTDIDVIATPEDAKSQIRGTGTVRDLKVGVNEHRIVVTSFENVERSYIVRITRLPNDNHSLESLEVIGGTLEKTFDPSDLGPYIVNTIEGQENVEFKVTIPDGSQVKGDGVVAIQPGKNTHQIEVTSESGKTNIYTFEIMRPSATSAKILDIIPSAGTLTPKFDQSIKEYTMEVEDRVSEIEFEVLTDSKNALISGHTMEDLQYGENKRIITVSSEDHKTQETITIHITRNREIHALHLEQSNILMSVDEVKQLAVRIEPENATNKEITWSSSNPDVVTVDAAGNLKAIKPGGAMVTVSSVQNPNVKAQIGVTVMNLTLTSETLDIKRLDDGLAHEDVGDYVVGGEPQTDIATYKSYFINEETSLFIFDKESQTIEDNSRYVGTSMRIKLIVNDVTYDELQIAIKGDLNGDGEVDVLDEGLSSNAITQTYTMTPIEKIAADVNEDTEVDVLDQGFILNFILKVLDSLNGIGATHEK